MTYQLETITQEHVTPTGPHDYCTAASDIGIGPGDAWPQQVQTTLGNGQAFQLVASRQDLAQYKQGLGCTLLTIFNT